MEMQQMMEMLLKEIKAGQEQMEKMEANRKADKEDFMAKLDADRRAVKEENKADRRDLKELMKMMTANQAKTDAKVTELTEEEEPASVDRKPEVAQQREVPVEDAVVIPVKGRKKRHRGMKKAAERREEPKELTRGLCGSRMKLAAACRKVSRRATVAWCKRIILRKSSTQRNCGPRKEVTAARIKITRCQDTGIWHETKTMAHQEARKEGPSGRDCGKARNETLA
jgi:hypothetical protein